MPPISLDSVLTQRRDLFANAVDGETILMRLDPAVYFGLAGTANRIWQLLAEPRTVDSICTSLESIYAVDPAICRAQVTRFLETLAAENLICVVARAAA